MGINRAMALSALILAIMLAIGAVQPDRPTAGAAHSQIIIIATPALPTLAPQLPAQQVEAPQQPAQQVEAPQQPAQQVEAPQLPAQQVEAPQQPAQQLEAPQQPAQQLEAPQQPAQQLEQPTADPALVPGTPEYNAALADIYANLPTIECPCGPAPAEYTGAMTDRQIRQSRARTR